jgi:putative ABC transport system ATP-binding protein
MAKKSSLSLSGPVYRLEKITKYYQTGQVQALGGINLTINFGEFIALVGSSGSGKSTLMHILGFLDRPDRGRMYLEEKEVSGLSEGQRAFLRRKKIGFVFQTFHLLSRLTALENVELPLIYSRVPYQERLRRAREELALVGLAGRLDHLPAQLSGGQQQRVAIARALINNPSVILADEPTGNLDSRSGDKIMTLLKKLHQQGRTIVLVTHDPKIAGFAERIVTIKDGLVVSDKRNVV